MTTKHHAHGAITPDSFLIVGGAKENIPGATRNVVDGDRFNVGHLSVEVMDSPCHTTGHVMYKIAHPQHPEDGMAIFTGDTIFMAGVGAFFEGNSEDMCAVMRRMFFLHGDAAAIEDARTFIFPGHEYTAGFLRFSERIFPDKSSTDVAFIQACAARTAAAVAEGLPSIPSTLAEEKRINMFMRVADPSFRQLMKQPKEVELMDYLYNACD